MWIIYSSTPEKVAGRARGVRGKRRRKKEAFIISHIAVIRNWWNAYFSQPKYGTPDRGKRYPLHKTVGSTMAFNMELFDPSYSLFLQIIVIQRHNEMIE